MAKIFLNRKNSPSRKPGLLRKNKIKRKVFWYLIVLNLLQGAYIVYELIK